jgi:hypothetical protein
VMKLSIKSAGRRYADPGRQPVGRRDEPEGED